MTKQSTSGSRLGLTLFFLYAAFYAGFVLVNAFFVPWAEWQPIEGLNLAVLWGFSLIVVALILAVVYGLANHDDDQPNREQTQ